MGSTIDCGFIGDIGGGSAIGGGGGGGGGTDAATAAAWAAIFVGDDFAATATFWYDVWVLKLFLPGPKDVGLA